MISKTILLKHLDTFPERFSIDELVEKLIFIEKLENRIKLSKANETLSENELENEMNEWLK